MSTATEIINQVSNVLLVGDPIPPELSMVLYRVITLHSAMLYKSMRGFTALYKLQNKHRFLSFRHMFLQHGGGILPWKKFARFIVVIHVQFALVTWNITLWLRGLSVGTCFMRIVFGSGVYRTRYVQCVVRISRSLLSLILGASMVDMVVLAGAGNLVQRVKIFVPNISQKIMEWDV